MKKHILMAGCLVFLAVPCWADSLEQTRQAAEQGNAVAQINLGEMYREGQGVPRDDAEAVKWYRKAAEQGYPKAQFNLGGMYEDGKGVPHDDAEAVKWYRKAAEQGHAEAQTNLGIMYDEGHGVPRDDAEAVKWYRKAAEQGRDRAQFNLGSMYDEGHGVPRDEAEAMKWYRKAAEQGHAKAQFNLGSMYAKGKGGLRTDYESAYMWFSLAAAQGNERAREALELIEMKELLTPKQKAEAEELVREWKPNLLVAGSNIDGLIIKNGLVTVKNWYVTFSLPKDWIASPESKDTGDQAHYMIGKPLIDKNGAEIIPTCTFLFEKTPSTDVVKWAAWRRLQQPAFQTDSIFTSENGIINITNAIGFKGSFNSNTGRRKNVIVVFAIDSVNKVGLQVVCEAPNDLFEKVEQDYLLILKSISFTR